MIVQGLFYVVLSLVPIATSVLGLGESRTRLNLVARLEDEVPQARPNPPRPQFFENKGVLLRLDWDSTIMSVDRHYQVFEPWDNPESVFEPWENSKSPPDIGLRAAAVYDITTRSIAFEFNYPETGTGLSENQFGWLRGRFVYRLPRDDNGENTHLLLVLPEFYDPEELATSIKLGEAVLLDYLRRVSRPDLYPSDMELLLSDMRSGMEFYAPAITPYYSLWIRTQMTKALNQLINLQKGFKVKRQLSIQHWRKEKRTDPIATIKGQEAQPSQNSTANLRSEFLQYQNAFYALQSNISNALFPVLNELINGSNNSIVYQMALSIYSDITLSKQQVIGPFSNGMTAFTWMEDSYMNSTNTTLHTGHNGTFLLGPNRAGVTLMIAVHSAYEKLYLSTWDKAINATNSTGLLSNLSALATNLLPKDASIYPPDWLNGTQSFLNSGDFQALARIANFSSSGVGKPSR